VIALLGLWERARRKSVTWRAYFSLAAALLFFATFVAWKENHSEGETRRWRSLADARAANHWPCACWQSSSPRELLSRRFRRAPPTLKDMTWLNEHEHTLRLWLDGRIESLTQLIAELRD